MPLKLGPIHEQVERMAEAATAPVRQDLLAAAREFFYRVNPAVLLAKLSDRQRQYPWLVAEPLDTLSVTVPAPAPPTDFSVIAADGSFIPPDRHSPLRFYVINTGHAVLTYGRYPDAHLDSSGRLYFEDAELYLDPTGQRIPIEGERLGVRMAVEEMKALREALGLASLPAIALRDGSLILWALQRKEESEVKRAFLEPFLACLDAFLRAEVPVASYISYTGSQEVVNALRVSICQDDPTHCERCSLDTAQQDLCRFLGTIRDRHLFAGILAPGERSALFRSRSAILEEYREHCVLFFYLNIDGEITRIEAPEWVMTHAPHLDLVHSLVYDQCQRSGDYPPYPPVLVEAHEQAVISTTERRMVEQLVEEALARRRIPYIRSAKDRSKRSRGV
ncbi:MAG: DNA double-strand break repair nuclease NurA [Anaerolineae bacterium]|nr:DNA double-strand break repair nuclease NurA [Anaerolineae bacterium]